MQTMALKDSYPDETDTWTSYARSGGSEPADFTCREGALALKAKIEAYWRERGQDVMISMQNVGFHPAIRAARYDVRSDMVNGLPRAATKSAPAHKLSLVETDADLGDGDDWTD